MKVTIADRASDLVAMVRLVVSPDLQSRRAGGDWMVDRTDSGGLIRQQELVLGQLCLWAWSIESDPDATERLEAAVERLTWIIPPAQALGFARAQSHPSRPAPDEDSLMSVDALRAHHPDAEPRLLDAAQCRRAVDLARGITSTSITERLHATRLTADVVASRLRTDDEAGCFVGLLSYAVVVESDPAVRHEQTIVLGVAGHHGRLSSAHREVARAADLTDQERTALGED